VIVQSQSPRGLGSLLARGLTLEAGPFNIHLRSDVPGFAEVFGLLYRHARIHEGRDERIIHFTVSLQRAGGIRRLAAGQVRFLSDQESPFHPFPADHAFPLFEWGLNWCIATQAHQYLLLHAAAVEKNGRALILPARPGSGKSTLCAALIHRGWRLLSDEFGVVEGDGERLHALPRPAALKNESIGVLGAFADEAVIGPEFPRTRKGRVAHVMPPPQSTVRADEPAVPGWVVFPQFRTRVETRLHPFPKGRAFLKLSGNAFNYRLLGPRAFRAVANIINRSSTYYLEFDSLDHAVSVLDRMAESTPGADSQTPSRGRTRRSTRTRSSASSG
jgi:HprK-related kinase A